MSKKKIEKIKTKAKCTHKWKFAYADTYSDGEVREYIYLVCEKCAEIKGRSVLKDEIYE
jgi:hypothetical protein